MGDDEAIYYYGRLIVPNDEGKLRIGMTTQNVIYVENAENVLSVPVMAVKGKANEQYVEVLTKTGLQQKPVEIGISDGLHIEIKSGLNEGDKVVLAHMSSAEISDKTANIKGPRRF